MTLEVTGHRRGLGWRLVAWLEADIRRGNGTCQEVVQDASSSEDGAPQEACPVANIA